MPSIYSDSHMKMDNTIWTYSIYLREFERFVERFVLRTGRVHLTIQTVTVIILIGAYSGGGGIEWQSAGALCPRE